MCFYQWFFACSFIVSQLFGETMGYLVCSLHPFTTQKPRNTHTLFHQYPANTHPLSLHRYSCCPDSFCQTWSFSVRVLGMLYPGQYPKWKWVMLYVSSTPTTPSYNTHCVLSHPLIHQSTHPCINRFVCAILTIKYGKTSFLERCCDLNIPVTYRYSTSLVPKKTCSFILPHFWKKLKVNHRLVGGLLIVVIGWCYTKRKESPMKLKHFSRKLHSVISKYYNPPVSDKVVLNK